jgi:hypothetical protein
MSTFDLPVQSGLDWLFSKLKIYLYFFNKQPYRDEEVNCTEPSLSLSVPCYNIRCVVKFVGETVNEFKCVCLCVSTRVSLSLCVNGSVCFSV